MDNYESSWKLGDHPMLPKGKTVVVVILDGWGEARLDNYNCIHVAGTSTMNSLKKVAPERWRLLKAHGTAVGLPFDDDISSCEVGHIALGAGRIYPQGSKLVDIALASGEVYKSEGFKYIKECFDQGTVHLVGLLTNGGLYSGLDQLQLFIKGVVENGAKRIRAHILIDGHELLEGKSIHYVETLENGLSKLREKGVDAQIASGSGRIFVTMDHFEDDWDVIKLGWNAHILGEALCKFQSALEAIRKLKDDILADNLHLPPFVIVDEYGKPVGPIVDGDAVVTFNFHADRMLMISKSLEYEDLDKSEHIRFPDVHYAGMLQCDEMHIPSRLPKKLKLPSHFIVPPREIEKTVGEYLVYNGIRNFVCSETVKFGHVTFFWNGNRSGYINPYMEEYVEIPSNDGIAFNVQPQMKAFEIAEKATEAVFSHKYDQVCVNLPNGDMLGHTGDVGATTIGCKAADDAVKMIIDAVTQVGGIFMITADHGNAEDMVKRNKDGQPILNSNGNIQILTTHTLHPVPIAIGGPGLASGVRFRKDIPDAGLANVAATVLNLHGFEAPSDYEPTLIEVVDDKR